jgi:hypothetical protein
MGINLGVLRCCPGMVAGGTAGVIEEKNAGAVNSGCYETPKLYDMVLL